MNKIQVISHSNGETFTRNRKLIADALKHFKDKDLVVTIEKKRNKRSDNQNRYYWGCLIPLVAMGLKDLWGRPVSSETAHEFLKTRFLFWERADEGTGEVLRLPKSTTECTTTELEEYMQECRDFALEWLNVTVPLPNEQLTIG